MSSPLQHAGSRSPAGLSPPAGAVPRPPICALQNFLRCQNNKTNYNLVCETLQFLDIMCGSTTGGLGLLGLYINEDNVGLVIQTLETLTEYCQGPCHENQVSRRGTSGSRVGGWSRLGRGETEASGCHSPEGPGPCVPPLLLQTCIVTHESNGIDIITALILNDISPLCKYRMDLVLQLKVGPVAAPVSAWVCMCVCTYVTCRVCILVCVQACDMCRLHADV